MLSVVVCKSRLSFKLRATQEGRRGGEDLTFTLLGVLGVGGSGGKGKDLTLTQWHRIPFWVFGGGRVRRRVGSGEGLTNNRSILVDIELNS